MDELISYKDFIKVDIRVGKILAASDFSNAKKPAFKLQIDFGSEIGIKSSSAQITKCYAKEELPGKCVIAVINFPPRQIADFFSEVLVLAVTKENDEVILLMPDSEQKPGLKIT